MFTAVKFTDRWKGARGGKASNYIELEDVHPCTGGLSEILTNINALEAFSIQAGALGTGGMGHPDKVK